MVKGKQIKVSGEIKTTKWQAAPLKGSFMILAMLGFFISAYLITNTAWRLAFLIVFTAMFIASIISMTKAEIIPEK